MRGKKFLAMLLSGMMIVGGLSACTGGGNHGSPQDRVKIP